MGIKPIEGGQVRRRRRPGIPAGPAPGKGPGGVRNNTESRSPF